MKSLNTADKLLLMMVMQLLASLPQVYEFCAGP